MSSTSSRRPTMATQTPGKDANPTRAIVMDPQAAWLLMLDAMESGHWRVVREQASDLLEWMGMASYHPPSPRAGSPIASGTDKRPSTPANLPGSLHAENSGGNKVALV